LRVHVKKGGRSISEEKSRTVLKGKRVSDYAPVSGKIPEKELRSQPKG